MAVRGCVEPVSVGEVDSADTEVALPPNRVLGHHSDHPLSDIICTLYSFSGFLMTYFIFNFASMYKCVGMYK